MKEILIKIVARISELSRSVENGDIELSDFREKLVDIVSEIRELPTDEEIKKNSQIEAEASVFWSKIAEYLPKSFERSALGDEKIYNAFYPAYLQFREVLLHTLQEEYKKDMRYNPMGVGEMLERWGKSLQNNPPI